MRRMIFVAFFITTMLTISQVIAQNSDTSSVPNLIRFSGSLKVLPNPSSFSQVQGVTFAVYKQQEGGAPLWIETQNVTLDANGRYSVLLGNGNKDGVPSDLFSGNEERWLGVQASGRPEQPRVLLVSVPYAYKAKEAETLGGLPASAFQLTPSYVSQAMTSGTDNSQVQTSGFLSRNASTGINGLWQGSPNYVPLWLSALDQYYSVIYQHPQTKNVGIGTISPLAKLDVNGGINAASSYFIGGQSVLSVGNAADQNIFAGIGSGTNNIPGSGTLNTFAGFQAGNANTAGNGNTFLGMQAGFLNTTGNSNTFTGAYAGSDNTTGGGNTFIGYSAGYSNTTGGFNLFSGYQAGRQNTAGAFNTFAGHRSGYANTTSSQNTFYGAYTGPASNGGGNTFVGYESGITATTGSGNSFFGIDAGANNTTGTNTTALGGWAGYRNVGGQFGTFVGNFAGPDPNSPNLYNSSAIGANAIVSQSNSLVLGGIGQWAVNVGIGTPTPSQTLEVVGNAKITGSGNGLIFPDGTKQSTAAAGGGFTLPYYGMISYQGSAFEVWNQLPTGIAIFGSNHGNTGALAYPNGPFGYFDGIYGNSQDGVAGDGTHAGVLGRGGAAAFGVAGVNTGNSYPGVQGQGTTGVVGTAQFSGNGSGTGVVGLSTSGYGVYGSSNTGPAGWFQGDVTVTGHLTKGSGSFKIDHPVDPTNKYLYHSFVESPDMKNIYDGVATLNSEGDAIVELPTWFEALNRDFRYQLTAIGQPAPGLFIAEEITSNRFRISGGSPGMRVSWQVTGIRHDAWANAHRVPVEQDKSQAERGFYLHPEVFGESDEKGVGSAYKKELESFSVTKGSHE